MHPAYDFFPFRRIFFFFLRLLLFSLFHSPFVELIILLLLLLWTHPSHEDHTSQNIYIYIYMHTALSILYRVLACLSLSSLLFIFVLLVDARWNSLKWNIIHTCSYDSHFCINECMRGLFVEHSAQHTRTTHRIVIHMTKEKKIRVQHNTAHTPSNAKEQNCDVEKMLRLRFL